MYFFECFIRISKVVLLRDICKYFLHLLGFIYESGSLAFLVVSGRLLLFFSKSRAGLIGGIRKEGAGSLDYKWKNLCSVVHVGGGNPVAVAYCAGEGFILLRKNAGESFGLVSFGGSIGGKK